MTDDMTPEVPMTAAELALGLLEGEERATALRRTLADPAFAAEVEAWRAHFGLLFDAVPDVAAPADGLARIERALSPISTAANDDSPVRLWRGIAVASSIAATLLLALVLTSGPAPVPGSKGPQIAQKGAASTPRPLLVAQIAPVENGQAVAAVFDPTTGNLRVAAAALVDAGHSPELWVIPVGGTPHSLGVLHSSQSTAVAINKADRVRFAEGATLAVTIEPVGGSPSGKPTGAVVAKGALSLI
ncbi:MULTISPECIES: anti-sigma factor domain-containing protein [unclassified Sphingomonas]|uniref:anti-sigma factor n=1 Tax=unclassified Sphingomonas TaxID=196159 RepID=UPI000BC95EC8|nr:MAG: hypothetical protein B7Z43_00895 [Sphingomonas sp. 12-62-6]OYX39418.1 MAG: hypothetical protein B7Y98_05735 [Sphingomonas sp. 32-62-10]OYY64203.1 MAG: hypothetical protein B7Y49_10680 [Sphingomonas sp. 28-62-11]